MASKKLHLKLENPTFKEAVKRAREAFVSPDGVVLPPVPFDKTTTSLKNAVPTLSPPALEVTPPALDLDNYDGDDDWEDGDYDEDDKDDKDDEDDEDEKEDDEDDEDDEDNEDNKDDEDK